MLSNISDLVKSFVSPELFSTASTFLGEEVSGISKAVDASIPAILCSVLKKAEQDPSAVFSLAEEAAGSGVLEDLPALFGGHANFLKMGTGLISDLFGNNTGVVSSLISSYAGIKPSSATTVLSTVAPLAMGILGKHANSNGLDAAGLSDLISSQKNNITQAIPAGLNFLGLTGNVNLEQTHTKEENYMGIPGWIMPLLLLVSGAMLVWYFMGESKEKTDVPKAVVNQESSAPEAPAPKQMLKVELPDGVILDAYKGGIEDQLVSFLKDPSAEAGKDVWFDFDNLNFATGTADITPESQAQVNNIAAILKAFPKAKIKIGGYTDKTGDETANLTLSRNRAEAVSAALASAGVGSQVTGAEGYGSQYAKIPVEAPETARAVDRRVSVSVREK